MSVYLPVQQFTKRSKNSLGKIGSNRGWRIFERPHDIQLSLAWRRARSSYDQVPHNLRNDDERFFDPGRRKRETLCSLGNRSQTNCDAPI